jgi:stearoyl-CoA desaturase (delta-9 desaturase)
MGLTFALAAGGRRTLALPRPARHVGFSVMRRLNFLQADAPQDGEDHLLMTAVQEPSPGSARGESPTTPNPAHALPLDWRNIFLLSFVHVVAIGGLATYLPLHGLSLGALIIGAVLTVLTIFSISAGYHRLFSHRAYQAHPALRFFLLTIGAGAFQNSVLSWAADHRRHHGRTDSDLDPYDAKRGFWHSHIGWVLRKADPSLGRASVRDLERDPLIVWQDRRYGLIGLATGVLLPTLLGLAVGDPWGGFIVGGAVRLMLCYHATFSINSFAHLIGSQPYSDKDSSRDSFITALVSMGEGYHNFHHTFPADYRNGVRAHQFDPTKWALRSLAAVGLARQLRRTPAPAILRARLRMDEQRLGSQVPLAAQPLVEQFRASVNHAVERWHDLVAQYELLKREATVQAREAMAKLKAEIRRAARELREIDARWRLLVRRPADAFAILQG